MSYISICDLVQDVYADFATYCLLTDFENDKRIKYSGTPDEVI